MMKKKMQNEFYLKKWEVRRKIENARLEIEQNIKAK